MTQNQPLIDYIYALVETNSNIKWYIGRTIHPEQRIKEHRYGARIYKEGDELKYKYANALDSLNLPWHLEVLMECGPGTEFFEDYFINKFRGEPLQNMKSGDSEPWMGRDYSSPEEFVRTRERILEIEKKKTISTKKESDPELTVFVDDMSNMNKRISPGLQEILNRRKK